MVGPISEENELLFWERSEGNIGTSFIDKPGFSLYSESDISEKESSFISISSTIIFIGSLFCSLLLYTFVAFSKIVLQNHK